MDESSPAFEYLFLFFPISKRMLEGDGGSHGLDSWAEKLWTFDGRSVNNRPIIDNAGFILKFFSLVPLDVTMGSLRTPHNTLRALGMFEINSRQQRRCYTNVCSIP
jgi:hypothetical protein